MNTAITRVAQGLIEGIVNKTASGYKYISFNGIPYAQPPIGKLRFQNPVPAEPWKGKWDATHERDISSQFEPFVIKQCIGSEDCLYLNIHVPKLVKSIKPLPVLIWIHGGAFQMGSGSATMYGPDYLVEKEMIVVNVNYRLGFLGFFCLHIPEAPGNLGLKDQALAIKWVKSNIKDFSGDPNNITLMGESAGAACVQLHIVSPVTTGLFQKAICSSGTCLSQWVIKDDPETSILRLADSLQCPSKDKLGLLNFFKSLSAEEIVLGVRNTFKNEMGIKFCPVVENKYDNQEPFLTQHPINIIKSGNFTNVPIINGFNSNEGLFFALPPLGLYKEGKFHLDSMYKFIEKSANVIPYELKGKLNEKQRKRIIEEVQKFYIMPEDIFKSLVNFLTDVEFSISVRSSSKLLSQYSSPVYSYCFSYNGDINLIKVLSGKNYEGASHSDELPIIFDNKLLAMKNITPTERDLKMRETFVNLLSNFTKYGNPTPDSENNIGIKWKPFKENEEYYLIIDDKLEMSRNVLMDRFAFWDKLLLKNKL